jgi:hypothetical protein
MTSTPQVDVEELERQLKREVIGDLRPIQFPDIGGVMSDEECRSNLASTTVVDEDIFLISWSDLYSIFNLDVLDVSLMRCFAF